LPLLYLVRASNPLCSKGFVEGHTTADIAMNALEFLQRSEATAL